MGMDRENYFGDDEDMREEAVDNNPAVFVSRVARAGCSGPKACSFPSH